MVPQLSAFKSLIMRVKPVTFFILVINIYMQLQSCLTDRTRKKQFLSESLGLTTQTIEKTVSVIACHLVVQLSVTKTRFLSSFYYNVDLLCGTV